jgi:RNA polymerase sigma factor (sigma-70 family)
VRASGHLLCVSDIARQRDTAFEVLFRSTYARVLSYARSMADAHDADDAVAETYAIAWRRLDELPPGAELGWLIGVTRRVLANTRRSQRRAGALRSLIGDQRQVPAVDPAERVADDDLRQALLTLRPGDREAIVLVAWFDLTPAEGAVALGIGPAAFRMRLTRARRRLRARLEPDSPDPMTTKEAPTWHPS